MATDERNPGVAEPGVAYEAAPAAVATGGRRRAAAGGSGVGGMDAWQQSVETRLAALGSKIDSQSKWLLGAYAAGFVLLAGLIVNRTDATNDRLSAKIDAVAAQVADVKADVAGLKADVAGLKTDVAGLKARPPHP